MNRAWSGQAALYFVVDPDDEEHRSPSMGYLKELYPFYGTPFTFVKGVGEYVPVRNEAVDLIVIQDALDHFLAPKTVIHETYRILCKDGLLAIMADVVDSAAQRNLLEDIVWVLSHKGLMGFRRGFIWKVREIFDPSINRHGHMREFRRADIVELLSIFAHVEVQEPSVPGFPHLYFFARK